MKERVPLMLKDGTYAAWFKTAIGNGTGIAHLADGKIWGRDSIMTYRGTCQVEGDRFTALVSTKRHTNGHATVFGGDDELTLRLEGTCTDRLARYVGTADEVPGVLLEGLLILSEKPTSVPEQKATPTIFRPDLLPKLPARGR
jgi:hypothetical protein